MAMLAEPRRKQKVINLRAKNNAWSNDSSKFGQRMLEKMGWTSGKGLGANENGITEHVVARYKNDEKGLGFEDKNDQWTKHEDDFNALLANLSHASDSTENLHSGISLEDKSKKSKARIHYHKFTRGKDISRYSEKDLANIFGKKSFKDTDVTEEPSKQALKITEQVFTEKGSMEDYFKNKLAAFKSKSKVSTQQNDDCDEPCYSFRGFSQETDMDDTFNGLGFKSNNENGIDKVNDVECDSEKVKKKKKKSKNKDNVYLGQDDQENKLSEQIEECMSKIKKEKKLKHKNIYNDLVEPKQNELTVECPPDETTYKKKKSKKEQKEHSDNKIIICGIVEEGEKVNKKKKKSKNKECVKEESVLMIDTSKENSDFPKRKNNNSEDVSETQGPKKKKKKKVKDVHEHKISL